MNLFSAASLSADLGLMWFDISSEKVQLVRFSGNKVHIKIKNCTKRGKSH